MHPCYASVLSPSASTVRLSCWLRGVCCVSVTPSADITLHFVRLSPADWAAHDVKYNGAYNRCERPFTDVGNGTGLLVAVAVVVVVLVLVVVVLLVFVFVLVVEVDR